MNRASVSPRQIGELSHATRKRGEHGVALVLVLLFIVIISGMVVAFFSNVTTESMNARSYATGASTKLLADSAVHLVEAQLRDATRSRSDSTDPGTALAWTSQPGLVRTFDSDGKAGDVYKLYSSDQMVLAADKYTPDDPDPDPDLSTDLNAPEADANGRLVYPIVYPPENQSSSPGIADQVEGFSIDSPPNYKPGQPASAFNNPAPMRVKWIYVLQDGTLSAAEKSSDEVISVPGATLQNPIVGRIAFWADDECAKVNINTASEGVYWDIPRVYSMEDFGVHNGSSASTPGLAICQPAQREWQRYPGHPATTSLSPIFGKVLPPVPPVLTVATSSRLAPYYDLSPRIVWGGSRGGTFIPTGPLTADRDRLYASVDELMFTPRVAGDARVPNTANGNDTEPNLITRDVLEKAKFFITANSSAPETTLFNTPRIAVWPVHSSDVRRTGYDKLSAFCSTVGGQPFYFTRFNPRSATQDLSPRNLALYEYLQALTSKKVPGFGGTFLQKYPAGPSGVSDRDQILTYIYDYIRCTNLQDRSNGAMSYTPVYTSSSALRAGEVLPIRIGQTQGFGRFYSISEADLLFYGTRAVNGRTTSMRALFVLEFASPQQGLGAMRSDLKYTVRGLDKLQFKVGSGGWQSLGFRPTGTNFMDRADLDTYHGRSLGGTEGPAQALLQSNGSIKNLTPGAVMRNHYPFISMDVTFDSGGAPNFEFQTLGDGEITVEISAADNNAPIQTVHLKFPPGVFRIPRVVGGSTHDYFSQRGLNSGSPFNLIKPEDTVVGLEPAGVTGKDSTSGDTRLVEGLIDVPADRFQPHKDYAVPGIQFAHGLLSAVGEDFEGGRYGKLVLVPSYQQTNNYNLRQPDVPSRVVQAVTRADGGPGEWDTGVGDQKDGAYINKPDEGDSAFDSNRGYLPYLFGFGQGFTSANNTYFSPNRMIPSPMMLGSIPTGVQRFLPWQTLLFHARPEDPNHPGKATPPDHLIADLFWMPVVEPYAISTPFSTAGKINLNYRIEPFRYIRRDTGIRAVMKSTKFLAIAASDSTMYKPIDPGNGKARIPNRRQTIDLDATLEEFEAKFENNEVFKSASQICEVNLIPPRERTATMPNFWRKFPLTGDNVREKPYVDLYSRLTTRSNAFTVHVRVQSLKKARNTPPDQWVKDRDQVLSEYRGSSLIERYIDPNDPRLPDFAKLAVTSPDAPELNIDRYYRMRVVSTKRFAP